MIAEPIRALLGEDLAGRVEEVLRGAGPEGGDLDLVAGNDGSYLPAGEVERRLRTAALRAGLAGLVHDPDDILPLVDLDAVETDGSGGLRTARPHPDRQALPLPDWGGGAAGPGRRRPRAPRRHAPQKLYHGGAGTPHHGGVQRGAEDRRAGGLRRDRAGFRTGPRPPG